MFCQNCGSKLDGRFCSKCGQDSTVSVYKDESIIGALAGVFFILFFIVVACVFMLGVTSGIRESSFDRELEDFVNDLPAYAQLYKISHGDYMYVCDDYSIYRSKSSGQVINSMNMYCADTDDGYIALATFTTGQYWCVDAKNTMPQSVNTNQPISSDLTCPTK